MIRAGEIAQQVAARLFARAFNDKAAKVRGFASFKACPSETRFDIQRMAAHFDRPYGASFGTGGSPVGLAERLTHLWWDMDPNVRDRAGR